MPRVSAPTFAVATQSDEHTQPKHDSHNLNQYKHTIFPVQAPAASSSAAHPVVNAELVAVIVAALGAGGTVLATSSDAPLQLGEYFSATIMNAMSDLPISVIKELKGRFKNYIPLSLCTHRLFHYRGGMG